FLAWRPLNSEANHAPLVNRSHEKERGHVTDLGSGAVAQVQDPIITVGGRREVGSRGSAASGTAVLSILRVDPFDVIGAIGGTDTDAAPGLKVDQIFLSRFGQAKSIINQVLARSHPIERQGG